MFFCTGVRVDVCACFDNHNDVDLNMIVTIKIWNTPVTSQGNDSSLLHPQVPPPSLILTNISNTFAHIPSVYSTCYLFCTTLLPYILNIHLKLLPPELTSASLAVKSTAPEAVRKPSSA